MAVIISRMPSTDRVTNIVGTSEPVEEVKTRWADNPFVTIFSDEQYNALPRCPTCGYWTVIGRCDNCR